MADPEQLADAFLAVHREFYDFVKDATAAQWRAQGINHPEIRIGDEDEGRPVGTIVHHVGNAYRNMRARCEGWISGSDPPLPSNETNRRHAADNSDPDQAETLRFLEHEANATAAWIRGLGPRELAAGGSFITGPTTVEGFVSGTMPFHIRWHLGSIQATWRQAAAGAPRAES